MRSTLQQAKDLPELCARETLDMLRDFLSELELEKKPYLNKEHSTLCDDPEVQALMRHVQTIFELLGHDCESTLNILGSMCSNIAVYNNVDKKLYLEWCESNFDYISTKKN